MKKKININNKFFISILVSFFIFYTTLPVRPFKKITLMNAPLQQMHSGHPAVMRSLIEGLKKTGIPFNHNPQKFDDVGDIVIVLSNIDALKQAIEWKKQGRINKLLAGPNLVVRSNEYNGIIGSEYIDIFNTPSQWVVQAYIEDLPHLKDRLRVWYSGVDTDYWNSIENKYIGENVAVYWKTEPEQFCINTENILRKFGWNPIRIRYGNYNQQQYKQLLSQCRFAVVLSVSESQGIALAEAWSMNVPTFTWQTDKLTIGTKKYSTFSSCPYLTEKTGKNWENFAELELILTNISSYLEKCSPREWVLNNMSDEKSIECLLTIINQLY